MFKKLTFLLLFVLFCVSSFFAQIPTNGLVAWYPFHGNANDSSGNGHNGTVNGATLTTDRFGNANYAYSFNGNGNIITLDNTIGNFGTSDFTISAWINGDYSGESGSSSLLVINRI